jgi:ABC-type multidrug transport system ATPase subunit
VSALIELGAGFHPEISGRENVVINGVMLGLTRKEIERKLPEIVAFSGLEEFIDEPVKTYSSGMYVRLGFAVAVHVDPDVLVVDEVLAVGDEAFAHRCLDTIADFSRRGKTIFFVSHSLALVEELCDRVLYLEHGKTKALGDPRETLARYRMDVADEEGERLAKDHVGVQAALRAEKKDEEKIFPDPPAPAPVEEPRRWGSREVEITGCRMLDASGAERYAFRSGESVTLEIAVTPRAPLSDFVFGIGIFTPEDVCVHGTNTEVDGFLPSRLDGPAVARVTLPALDLGTGAYLVDVAVHSRREAPYDYWRGACRFQVDAPDRAAGVYWPERRWTFEGPLALRDTRDGK